MKPHESEITVPLSHFAIKRETFCQTARKKRMCTQFGLVLITHRVPYRSHFFYFFIEISVCGQTLFLICRFPSDKEIKCRNSEIKFLARP